MDITNILEAVITLAVALVTGLVIPLLRQKLGAEKLNKVATYVQIAVEAAEQIFRESGKGAEKKAYVIQWLSDHNITVDSDKLDAMIESAVYNLGQAIMVEDGIEI